MKTATKNDWKICEMPTENDFFYLEREFSTDEIESLRIGIIPQNMDDRWFCYMEGNNLFWHRSWTGCCVFILEINPSESLHRVQVNRNKNQFNLDNPQEEKELLNHLLTAFIARNKKG